MNGRPPPIEGRLLVGMATPEQADGLRRTLLSWGWAPDEMADYAPRGTVDELAGLFGHGVNGRTLQDELRAMQRFVDLARDDHFWLLVAFSDAECACQAARSASLWGASMAVPFELHSFCTSH